ncbi:MAG: Nif3-like dinuclear metal center hexameric protein [Marinilabiliales bacterium]|nr:MAG: Nif3-like dinuclear metal center hexameric protein [Marinilabiliales bacterium]
MIIKKLTTELEKIAPLNLQESYDNSGLIIGNPMAEINKALICLDVTPEVINEALSTKCDIIIAHHPIIFKGLKRITGASLVEEVVYKAIKNDIAIYAIHTNLDNVSDGVNSMLAEKLGIKNPSILSAGISRLNKIVTFCPSKNAEDIREAMFSAGAGHIGNYDNCSFNSEGKGSFKALEGTNPYVGKQGKVHFENETRIETVVPDYKTNIVVNALIEAHPYEEVAYDIYPLDNIHKKTGAGMIGKLDKPMSITDYLQLVKKALNIKYLKHNKLINKQVETVAICGGSGSFLIDKAARQKADLYISGDIKYHEFFEHQGIMTIVDAGHYETEQYTKELIHAILTKKFPNFAIRISETNTNPVSFL